MARDLVSDTLVAAQFGSAAVIGWSGPPGWRLPRAVSAVAAGCVGVGAGFAMTAMAHLGRDLRPAVEPKQGSSLRTTGAFRVSRHPVYAGLLLASTGAAVLRRRPEPLLGLAVLAGVLHVKTAEEERRLAARFGRAYAEYAARTPRLIGLPGRVEQARPVS